MKNNILDKISKQISSLGKLSRKVIIYGSIISFAVFMLSAVLYYLNNIYIHNYALTSNCIAMMKSCVDIFAEVIIGGLIMDNIIKMYA